MTCAPESEAGYLSNRGQEDGQVVNMKPGMKLGMMRDKLNITP